MSDLNWVSVWAFENNRTGTCLRQSPGIQVCIMGALAGALTLHRGEGILEKGRGFYLELTHSR